MIGLMRFFFLLSGDHDMSIPYMSTLKWIRQLNLTIDDQWRAWTVNGQIAGSVFQFLDVDRKLDIYQSENRNFKFILCRYTEIYKKHQAYLTFATIKARKSFS